MSQLTKPQRILIVRTDRLGDLILSTPLIANLRREKPNAYIAALVQSNLADAVRGNPYLNQVILLDKRNTHRGFGGALRLVQEIRRQQFDLALILHPTLRMHVLLFLSGIPRRIGYRRKWGFLNTSVLEYTKHLGQKHESQYVLEFLYALGIQDARRELYMPVYEESEAWAEHLLERHKRAGRTIITLHPQASCQSKMWPREFFDRLVSYMREQYNATVIFVGHRRDETIAESDYILNLTGQTSLAQLASILKRCNLFVSNDSGPVHVAVALQTPVISIFGRKQPGLGPRRWGPIGRDDISMHKDVGCEVCLAHDCKRGFACLHAIQPEDVFRHVDQLLARHNTYTQNT